MSGRLHHGDRVTTRPSRRGKSVARKKGWLNRRQWPTAPDGFSIVIPTWWKVPGAQAAPTMPDGKRAETSLRATQATVAEIFSSGAELPSPLFRATGEPGTGVTIGVYRIGIGDDQESLRQRIIEALPTRIAVTEVAVSRLTGVEVLPVPAEAADGSGLVYTTDTWVEVPRRPGWVAVVRFRWTGSSWDDGAATLGREIADTFQFLVPGQFRGRLNHWVLRRFRYFEPPDHWDLAAPAKDGCRAAGWRLGVVFHTAQLNDQKLGFFTFTQRPKDAFLPVAVCFAWIAVVYGFLADYGDGAGEWVFYAGSGPITAWSRDIRHGRSALGLLVTLGGTLGLGFALS
jgi:hypothetical protein